MEGSVQGGLMALFVLADPLLQRLFAENGVNGLLVGYHLFVVDFCPRRRTYLPTSRRFLSMTIYSILFPGAEDPQARETPETPAFFQDLNLHQVIDAITAGKDSYNLKPLFYTCVPDSGVIAYRHEVLRDLESEELLSN